jgi:hypothetical protein
MNALIPSRGACALFATLACSSVTLAQTSAPPPKVPAATKPAPAPPAPGTPYVVSAADLEYATRVAMAQGVITLKKLAEKDPMGWIIPPIQKVRVTGYKDVPRKYRIVEVPRPVYEYTDVVVFIPGPSPGEPPIKQIRKQPTKQIGTVMERHIRWDPEGDMERIDKQPIYEHVGDTSWHFNLIGDSAMALTALRAAGLPEGDPVVQRMVENIFGYLETYGPPDHTWNLAWLSIAMARTDGEQAAEWTEKLASRILDGQITDGAARGLWGPVCVHPRLVSVLMRDYLACEAELAKRQAKAKEKPTKANQALALDAEGDRNRLKKYTDSWSRFALKFATVEFPLVWDDQMAEKVQFLGYTDFFYNQRSADMESTWVALHALSVCSEAKRLPKESLRPEIPAAWNATPELGSLPKKAPTVISQLNATTVPPEPAMAVLARAANALASLQPENGQWSECNMHQPVSDFDGFSKFLPVPVDPASFPKLDSPATAVSAAQGAAALDSICRIVGMEKLAKFEPNYLSGARARMALQQEFIKASFPAKPLQRPTALRQDLCNLLLAASRPLQLSVAETSAVPADDQLTRLIILAGDADGGWGSKFRRVHIPTSSRARYDALKDVEGRVWRYWRLDLPIALNKAHVGLFNVTPHDSNISPGAPFATAAAVLYLASRLEKPGATLEQLSTDPTLAQNRKGLDAVLLTPLPPKLPPVVAAKAPPPGKPAAPAAPTAEEKAITKIQEGAASITIKPADTAKKKDEAF